MNLNKAILVGNLTRDPELAKLPSGTAVCNFSIATNESYVKDGQKVERAEFHNVVIYGNSAENCAKYLKKGQQAMVEGKITTRSWQKEDGTKAYKTEIIAFSVQFGQRPNSAPGRTDEPEPVIDAETGDVRTATPSAGSGAKPEKAVDRSKAKIGSTDIEYPTEEINPDDIPF